MRLLLVEDEKRMAQALCEILRLEKYEVDHCANGLDGLATIESGIFDIVILDVMLPGMDGYKITKQVRSKGLAIPCQSVFPSHCKPHLQDLQNGGKGV